MRHCIVLLASLLGFVRLCDSSPVGRGLTFGRTPNCADISDEDAAQRLAQLSDEERQMFPLVNNCLSAAEAGLCGRDTDIDDLCCLSCMDEYFAIKGRCHPSHATVEIEGGRRERMDELEVGANIRTPHGFEPIVGFSHKDAGGSAAYLEISFAEGRMAVIPGHLIHVDGGPADPRYARVGQMLTTPTGPTAITGIEWTFYAGLYHLRTPSGKYTAKHTHAT